MPIKKRKTGINQPLVCKRCGKRVGYVTIKPRLKLKILIWGFIFVIISEIIASIIVSRLGI